jgi:uncharacterized protein
MTAEAPNDTSTLTWSGIWFDFINPQPHMYNIADIAVHLSRVNRFNGGTIFPYSVAQHCCIGSRWMKADGLGLHDQMQFMMHDLSEAYMSDISNPLKEKLDDYKTIEDTIMQEGLKTFGLHPVLTDDVVRVDKAMFETEWEQLKVKPMVPKADAKVSGMPIEPWTHDMACNMFLKLWNELRNQRAEVYN